MYAQLLIAASFAVAAYQDVRERAVSDLVWVPALAGIVLVFYSMFSTADYASLEFEALRLVLFGGVGFAFVYLGMLGEADLIALVFFAADPYSIGIFIAFVGVVAVLVPHVIYLLATGEGRGVHIIPVERFLKEQKWIPKATILDGVRTEVNPDVNVARDEVEAKQKEGMTVESTYGVPDVLYFGAGYIFYIVYLIVFNYGVFASLP